MTAVVADFTILSRVSDALPLVEDWTKNRTDESEGLRKQALSVIKALSEQYKNQRIYVEEDSPVQNLVINASNDKYKFYVGVGGNLIALSIFEGKFHPASALNFLTDVRKLIIEHLKPECENPERPTARAIADASIAYQYISLDRSIRRKRGEYKTSSRNDSIKTLHNSLDEVSQLMQRNINDLLVRGENLDAVSSRADHLRETSQKFAKRAKRLSSGFNFRTYAPFAAGGFIILTVFYFVIFH